jgi:hypothetical protein
MIRWIIRVVWLAYAVFFAFLGTVSVQDDFEERYPEYFIWPMLISYVLIFIGILLHVAGRSLPKISYAYRAVLPVSILLFMTGMWLDSTSPENLPTATTPYWISILIVVTLTVLPAYWANYRFAFKRRKDQSIDHSVFD